MIEAWHVMLAAGALLSIVLFATGHKSRACIAIALTLGVGGMRIGYLFGFTDDFTGLFLWLCMGGILARHDIAVAVLCLLAAICYPLETVADYYFSAHVSYALQVISNAFWCVAIARTGGVDGYLRRRVGKRRAHDAGRHSVVARDASDCEKTRRHPGSDMRHVA